jgi:TonB family protein
MSMLGHARNDKARQAINVPALLIVALAHGVLFTGAVSPFAGESGSAYRNPVSLQVALLPGVTPPLPPLASSSASETASAKEAEPIPVRAPATEVAPPNAGVPAYYPASALSRMPEVDGFFDVPVPPGLSLHGQIELRLWIDAAGTLDRIAVQSSGVPASYQQAAVAAFQRMRYRPGQIDGRPVAAFVDIVVEMSDRAPPADVSLP